MKKRMLTATLAGAFGVALSASAALAAQPTITDTAAGTTYTERYIALEVYNNATGINADNVPFFVHTQQQSQTGNAINIQVINGKVNEGAGQLFISARPADVTLTASCEDGAGNAVALSTVADANGFVLVGESAAQGVVQPVTTTVYDNNTLCTRNGLAAPTAPGANTVTIPAGSILSTQHGTINNAGVATTTVKEGINLSVDSNLNPNCDTFKTVTLSYVTNKESATQDVLQIRPQVVALQFTNDNALTATLDSDTAFTTFLDAVNPTFDAVTGDFIDNVIGTAVGSTGPTAVSVNTPLFSIIDQQAQGIVSYSAAGVPSFGDPGLFTSTPLSPASTAKLSYTVNSSAAEPGVSMKFNNVALTNTGNTWAVSNAPVTLADVTANNLPLVLTNDTTKSMNPSVWTLSNVNFGLDSFQVGGAASSCVKFNGTPTVGSWTGGLEAYVPFVKTGAGYETFIKLSNRYSKPAPIFIAALSGSNATADSTVTSTTQLTLPGSVTADLTTIPTNGQVTIAGADLVANGIVSSTDALNGVAVKILIRVPAQIDFLGGTLADPYITGIVVSTTPTTQRSIPLDFKLGKNGGLVSN